MKLRPFKGIHVLSAIDQDSDNGGRWILKTFLVQISLVSFCAWIVDVLLCWLIGRSPWSELGFLSEFVGVIYGVITCLGPRVVDSRRCDEQEQFTISS